MSRDEEESALMKNKEVMLEDSLEDVENLYTDFNNDSVGAGYLKMAQYVSFSELCTYTIELPISEHLRPDVKVAKRAEIKNLQVYDTFEEVKDKGQTTVGSRWVITEKEQHDSQKQKCKARLVARGFQESLKPQSDSPTALKESFKLLMAISANFGFKLASVDIRAAFMQSKFLNRDVYVEPPADIKKPGILCKLMKPLYGLDATSRKFWLRVKDVFLNKLDFQTNDSDNALYYLNINGKLHGAVITHVNDFNLAGMKEFAKKVISVVKEELTVSKIEEDIFRFSGLDVKVVHNRIEISMEDYSRSL